MARVTVKITDIGKDFALVQTKELQVESRLDMKRLAKACEKIIQSTIMEKSKMPTGHLASLMIAEPIVNGWGVGDIKTLDSKAKYWNHIDKGSEGIGANWSHFLPKGFWANGRWVESESGYAGIKPMTPIPPMNYIATTLSQMEVLTPRILNRKT